MPIVLKRLIVPWLVLSAPLTSFAAAADLRLVEAVKNREGEVARALVKQKVDVNTQQGDGATALHWAARWDDVATASLLLRSGANPNIANDYGIPPLFLACTNRSAVMVDALLGARADPNATSATGETALMRCARTGNAATVEALFRHGVANVNATEPERGQTALMLAVADGHAGVVKLLLARGANVNARTTVRRLLVLVGGSIPGETPLGGFTPMLFAARQGSVETAQALLAAGANLNDTAPDGNSALVVASHSGHGRLAGFLLEHGADPNAAGAGYTALHAAVLKGDVDLVKALVAHRANPNARITKGTPVFRESTQYSLGSYLAGATPFLLAAKFAEIEILRVLGSHGADPLLATEDLTTPLMMAAGVTWRDGLQPADRRDRAVPVEVTTALMADESHTLEAVKAVVELGGDVNAANASGDTALHAAASKRFESVVAFLVGRGGNMDAKNKRGQTPADLLKRMSVLRSPP